MGDNNPLLSTNHDGFNNNNSLTDGNENLSISGGNNNIRLEITARFHFSARGILQ